MTEDDEFEGSELEPGSIGVGMGGSCPVCRAPVDLGQEFCLECGSPIRFTPRQRRQQRGRGGDGPPASGGRMAAAPPSKAGFPWIPFLVVLALIGGGVAFALVDGGGDKERSSSKESTEDALPTITNSAPTETTSETETTTVADCSQATIDDTVPAVGETDATGAPTIDPTTGLPTTSGEEIPELGTEELGGLDGTGDVPSTDSDPDSGAETITVDVNGNLCDGSDSSAPVDPSATTPGETTPTTSTDGTSTTPTSTVSGDWPADEEGWTVIVAGYANDEQRARAAAADLQEQGFTDGGVLLSDDFNTLCPGFWVVFSGRFDSQSQANRRKDELAEADYAGMNIREIKRSGPERDDCQQSRPQN